MQTYLFYDIETTGLSECFDQILHFAAIRTDADLKELQRYELKVKLNPDNIPSPRAMITHRMRLSDIADGISEYDAIKQIHQWVNQPGTISLGYNTLDFDDTFLRFGFYRNLLSPYTHQFKNNCGRLDIYPMAVMFFLFKKNVIEWPEINGKTSLKLEEINAANKFVTGRSHHAMVDVEATVALARCFKKENTMWNHLTGYFNKQEDEKRTRALTGDTALMIRSKFGASQDYQRPVLFIGDRTHYRQSLWLQLDTEDLAKTTIENITDLKCISHKKSGEPPFILPPRFLEQLKPERLALAEENKKWLKHSAAVYQKLVQYQINYRYPSHPEADADARLYLHDFWSFEEETICRAFHAANPKEKSKIAEKIKNPQLQALAIRIIGRHFPENLTSEQAEKFKEHIKKENVIDHQGKNKLTAKKALEEIAELRNQPGLDREQLSLLEELENYYI